jgi:ABC-type polysaccharide/polyol phosphate transport system ATPase subunit
MAKENAKEVGNIRDMTGDNNVNNSNRNIPMTQKDEVLSVRNLTKIYSLYSGPAERFKELLLNKKKHNEFTALNEVSFSVKKGETIGIIGENGAGKSTLLQLVAGTLSPTSGEIMVNGRVLALLELGVGFHPDFTGRENIFFYGDMLGLSRSYVRSKLDEILEFSELGDFIDRTLKTYSTGMQMRLAFSLVSSLDPDILIIDEALSVGDMHFQKKCIERVTDFKNKGITIIFCSHSMYQVGMLCDNVIWLKDGRTELYGETPRVISAYEFYQMSKGKEKEEEAGITSLSSDHPVIIKEFQLVNNSPLKRGNDLVLRILVECLDEFLPYNVNVTIRMDNDRGIFATGTHLSGKLPIMGKKREILITYPNSPLMGGIYYAVARLFDDKGLMVYHERVLPPFEVEKDSLELGVCYFENKWEIL